MILDSLVRGFREGDLEGRCSLLSAILLSLAIHTSGFSPLYSLSAIAISTYFSSGRNLRLIVALSPFLLLVLISGAFFSFEYSLSSALAFAGVISAGAVVYSSSTSEVGGAMIFLRVPERFVVVVQMAVATLPLLASDLKNVWLVTEGKGIGRYARVMRALISTAVLRALNMSEALYSKSFSYRAVFTVRRPDGKSLVMLGISLLLFLSTLPRALFSLL
ncbi:hypothetical protein GAH_01617 [Geoglobus ahangari]|uniref:Cobalt ABC transporter permease n=1 Tax=Geoglobus ahangari TaxID=113653 RepID=A0A0F7DBH4_9EURY|nr:hypothetical protein [Geoglobus ahangari]AKG91096.1 hypothetical protein GAH_01617 [Geoglobus ahangari]